MKTFPLWKRAITSLLDKVIIFVIFLATIFTFVYSKYTAPGKLGTYSYLITVSPSTYAITDRGREVREANQGAYQYQGISTEYLDRESEELNEIGYESSRDVFLKITICFLLVNLVYYLVCNLIFGTSLFNRIFGARLVDDKGNLLTDEKVYLRMAIFAMILALTLGLHFLLNLPYLWVCAIMALIYEAPVFFKKQNLLDYLCKNHLNDGRQLTKPSTVPAIVNGDKPKEAVSLIEESVAHSDEKFHEVQDAAPEQEVGIEPVLETKTKTSLNSKAQSIAAVILLLIGLVVTHTLLSYFLADYYNN